MSDGVLLIHGFGGSVSEFSTLEDLFVQQGLQVRYTRLKGHTGVRKDMRKAKYQDWIASAQEDLEALQKECEKVFIVGFSMGGLIAVNLANSHSVAGVAMLNSPIYYWHKRQIVRNVCEDLQQKQWDHINFYLRSTVKFPLKALVEFNLLLRKTKHLFKTLKCPVFVAQGLKDDTVSPKSAKYIWSRLGSTVKTLKYYNDSGHLICHSSEQHVLFRDLGMFIREQGQMQDRV